MSFPEALAARIRGSMDELVQVIERVDLLSAKAIQMKQDLDRFVQFLESLK